MPGDENLKDKELEAAIWYVKHRELLRKIALGLFIVVDVVLVGWVLFSVGRDFVSGPQRQQQDAELTQTLSLAKTSAPGRPQDLQLGSVELLTISQATDVVAKVRNPNPQWAVQFEYTIGLGEKVEKFPGFLLPEEERPFFRTIKGGSSGQVVFNIDQVSWRRIDARITPEVASFKAERLNFATSEPQFIPASDVRGLSRATVRLTNKTAYSYFAPKFIVLLYRGSRLIGIQSVVVDRFVSGETRTIETSWFDRIGAVSNIEVVPEIDIFDPSVYLKP